MPDLAIVNGNRMPLAEATISVLDLGFLRGVGAFETLRTYDGHPHALAAHYQRWIAAAEGLGIPAPLAACDLRREVVAAIAASGYRECRINLILTPGLHTGGVFGAADPTRVAILRELQPPPIEQYRDGVRVVTFQGERVCPQFKTTAYITGRAGLLAAERAGAQEALYVDARGEVSEGVTSNVLLLTGETVISPAAPNLPGITRLALAAIARELGLGWEERPVSLADLLASDEVWLSSSVRELVSVIAVDGHPIRHGVPGPWAERLRETFRARAQADAAADAAADA